MTFGGLPGSGFGQLFIDEMLHAAKRSARTVNNASIDYDHRHAGEFQAVKEPEDFPRPRLLGAVRQRAAKFIAVDVQISCKIN